MSTWEFVLPENKDEPEKEVLNDDGEEEGVNPKDAEDAIEQFDNYAPDDDLFKDKENEDGADIEMNEI